jgi:hypothetical protein
VRNRPLPPLPASYALLCVNRILIGVTPPPALPTSCLVVYFLEINRRTFLFYHFFNWTRWIILFF